MGISSQKVSPITSIIDTSAHSQATGSWVMANIWFVRMLLSYIVVLPEFVHHRAMTHDPAVYPDPDKFDPDRFAEASHPAQPDPRSLTFGFGRRYAESPCAVASHFLTRTFSICPGQLFADASIFLTISRVLWAFDIFPELDENGTQVVPEVAFTNAHTSYVIRFFHTHSRLKF